MPSMPMAMMGVPASVVGLVIAMGVVVGSSLLCWWWWWRRKHPCVDELERYPRAREAVARDPQWVRRRFRYVTVRRCVRHARGRPFTVPLGFLAEGAFGLRGEVDAADWLLHEWMYAKQRDDNGVPVTREFADEVLRSSMRQYALDVMQIIATRFWDDRPGERRLPVLDPALLGAAPKR